MTTQPYYVLANTKPWNVEVFRRRRTELPGQWTLIENKDDLTLARLALIGPRYVFLPHWSWRVPDEIVEQFECVCFHMTDVPYGRGGSPLQNLILRGHDETRLSALRMVHELDAGPVYMKRPLLLTGAALEIYERAAELTFDMIGEIVRTEPQPKMQVGEPVVFNRRNPSQSELPRIGSPTSVYDFIRMLDAESYPRAFVDWGDFRLEFEDSKLEGDRVVAKVSIKSRGENS